ncbi:MAG: cytochrome c biogenesis protein CcdA [Candidatus Bathyarchaeia archaeon]
MNLALAVLAFLGGFSSFLSPCAFPLLPVYVIRWISEGRLKKSLSESLKTSLTVILGLETVLVIFVLLPIYLVEKTISLIPIIGIILGIFLVFLGIVILSGKIAISTQIWFKGLKNVRNPYVKQFFYGLIYALNSLTCSLPILLMMLSASLVGGEPLILFIVFSAGMNTPMFLLILFSSLLGNILMKKFKAILPYIGKIEASIAIIIGFYLILTNLNLT